MTADTRRARQAAWERLRTAAAGCRECPLGALATQTVWGEGRVDATLMTSAGGVSACTSPTP